MPLVTFKMSLLIPYSSTADGRLAAIGALQFTSASNMVLRTIKRPVDVVFGFHGRTKRGRGRPAVGDDVFSGAQQLQE